MFCLYWSFSFLPATEEILCYYAQFLSRSFKAVSSIRNYISGVKKLHLFLDYSFPKIELALPLTLKGLERLHPHCPHRAYPMSPDILRQIFQIIDISKPVDSVIWSLFLSAFFTLARKSNLVGVSSGPRHTQVLRQDFFSQAGVLIVQFRWTKTIQFGERVLRIPLVTIPGSVLCPVKAYFHMVKLVPAPLTSPAFVFPSKRKLHPVTYRDLMNSLRHLVTALGLDPSLFSSHSFRRGGATFAFQANVPGELIRAQGDWLSQAYLNYLDLSMEKRTMVAESMRDHILAGKSGR